MPELTGTRDIRSYLGMFWRWKWLFLVFVVIAPLIAYLLEHGQPATYRSSALVGINSTTVISSSGQGSGGFSTSNVTAIAQLVTTTPVADIAAGLLNPPADPGQIAGEVSATGDTTTNFLTITAVDRNRYRAGAVANAFARAISQNLKRGALDQINHSIKAIYSQLAHIGAGQTATRAQLQQQLDQLIASRASQGSEAAILQPAGPGTLAGTSTRRTLELGLLIGILLGFGAIVLAESADRKLRTPEDLETTTKLPLLAAIEPSAFSGDLTTTREDDEAFQMLRTALMYFNVDTRLDSVLITSAGEKDGKTTVAIRLALVCAGAGMTVTLVDADLRRAQVSGRLKLHAQSGLGAAIAGTRHLSDVIVDFPLEEPASGKLRVVPAGVPPPNPSALMSSPEMQRILHELEAESDLVIVDTPAALAVSDPVPLMRTVSGVVVVARMNQTGRQSIRRLQKIIESAQGNQLGAVATGTASAPGYGHYYPKYYTQNGTNGGHSRRHLLRRG